MPVLHLICGPVAAGKSTYSMALAEREEALILSMDKWMQTLFGADIPKSDGMNGVDFAWFAERVDRCEDQMWDVAKQALDRGSSVIFDWGFIRSERREKAILTARRLGYDTQWHIVDAPLEVRRCRVSDRNLAQGDTFAFAVTPAMFDFAEHLYQTPSTEELPTAVRAIVDEV